MIILSSVLPLFLLRLRTEVQYDLYETDKKWALLFELNVKADVRSSTMNPVYSVIDL